MSIIMVDTIDCYARAKKFAEMSEKCRAYANELSADNAELSAELAKKADEFDALNKDITEATDVWTYFYDHNVRTD